MLIEGNILDTMKFKLADFEDDGDYAGNDELTPIVLRLVEERIAHAAKNQKISVRKFKKNKEAIRMLTTFIRVMVEKEPFEVVKDKEIIFQKMTIKECIDRPQILEACMESIRDSFREKEKYLHITKAIEAMY